MQFLERDQAIATLMDYALDARAGVGRIVLVSGELEPPSPHVSKYFGRARITKLPRSTSAHCGGRRRPSSCASPAGHRCAATARRWPRPCR